MGDLIGGAWLEDLIEKMKKKTRKYKFSQATQKKDKKNGLNCRQHKLRPDILIESNKTKGTQKRRGSFSTSSEFNEEDC